MMNKTAALTMATIIASSVLLAASITLYGRGTEDQVKVLLGGAVVVLIMAVVLAKMIWSDYISSDDPEITNIDLDK